MSYMVRVVTAGRQEDTLYATAEEAWKALRSCQNLAMLFKDGGLIGFNEKV
jgi:hypothetical protein